MWEKFWDVISKVATLTKDTDHNSQEIKEIRADIRYIYSKLEDWLTKSRKLVKKIDTSVRN